MPASPVRVLSDADLPAVRALLALDPISNVFVSARVEAAGCESWRLGAEMWGCFDGDEMTAACYAGANLVPVNAGPSAQAAFAQRAKRQGRRCSSIVGPADAVLGIWQQLREPWGPAREVRGTQPLMAIDGDPSVAPDPLVRRVRPDEIDVLLPASIAMFTEEVGVSPTAGDGGALYRSRVLELVALQRSFARIEDGRVVFKAEVGAVAGGVCQVQGVWVAPAMRGRGLSRSGMAAVVQACRERLAPVVSLYVNDYNLPARRAYESVGFRHVGTFASVLF